MSQSSEHGYSAKRQNTNSSSEPKSKEEQLKVEIQEQLDGDGHAEHFPSQVFIRREGWEEKMERAAEETKQYVLPKLKEKLAKAREDEEDCVSDPDASDESSVICGGNQNGAAADKFEIERASKFIDALPRCRLLDLGFHINCRDSCEWFITIL